MSVKVAVPNPYHIEWHFLCLSEACWGDGVSLDQAQYLHPKLKGCPDNIDNGAARTVVSPVAERVPFRVGWIGVDPNPPAHLCYISKQCNPLNLYSSGVGWDGNEDHHRASQLSSNGALYVKRVFNGVHTTQRAPDSCAVSSLWWTLVVLCDPAFLSFTDST